MLLVVTHRTSYLNIVLLKEEGKSGEEKKRYFSLPKLISPLKRGCYSNFIFKLLAVPIGVCYDLLRLH